MGWVSWAISKGIEHERRGTLDDVIDAFPVMCIEALIKPYKDGDDIKKISGKVYLLEGEEIEKTDGLNAFITTIDYMKAQGIDLLGDKHYSHAIKNEAPYLFKETLRRLPNLDARTFGIYISLTDFNEVGDVLHIPAFIRDESGALKRDRKGGAFYSSSGELMHGKTLDQIPRDSERWDRVMKLELFRKAFFAYKVNEELSGYDRSSLQKAFAKFSEIHSNGEVSY